jgi:hypothetical protein
MYPQSPPINRYDPKTLDALGEAFDATGGATGSRSLS